MHVYILGVACCDCLGLSALLLSTLIFSNTLKPFYHRADVRFVACSFLLYEDCHLIYFLSLITMLISFPVSHRGWL